MLKGETPETIFIAHGVCFQVDIDPDDAVLWRICKIQKNYCLCSKWSVLTLGPVEEVICESDGIGGSLMSANFAVAYTKKNEISYAKYGQYSGDMLWWGKEVKEDPSGNECLEERKN